MRSSLTISPSRTVFVPFRRTACWRCTAPRTPAWCASRWMWHPPPWRSAACAVPPALKLRLPPKITRTSVLHMSVKSPPRYASPCRCSTPSTTKTAYSAGSPPPCAPHGAATCARALPNASATSYSMPPHSTQPRCSPPTCAIFCSPHPPGTRPPSVWTRACATA